MVDPLPLVPVFPPCYDVAVVVVEGGVLGVVVAVEVGAVGGVVLLVPVLDPDVVGVVLVWLVLSSTLFVVLAVAFAYLSLTSFVATVLHSS